MSTLTKTLPLVLGKTTSKTGGGGGGGGTPSVSVNPSAVTLSVGQTRQLAEVHLNVSGSATWASSNTSVATVNSSGIVTAVAVGTATITATVGGTVGSAALTVLAAVNSLSLDTTAYEATPGYLRTLTATPKDASNASLDASQRTITWTTSDASIATISASTGTTVTVNPIASGTATITATCEGKTTTCTVSGYDSSAAELAYIRGALGDASIFAIWTKRRGVINVNGSVVEWDEARNTAGCTLTAPTTGQRPGFDATTRRVQGRGGQRLKISASSSLNLQNARAIVYVGSILGTGSGTSRPMASISPVFTSAPTRELTVGTDGTNVTGTIRNSSSSASTATTDLAVGTKMRVVVASKNASTLMTLNAIDKTALTATAAAGLSTGNNGVVLFSSGDTVASYGEGDCSAVLALTIEPTAAQLEIIKTWATTYHGAELASTPDVAPVPTVVDYDPNVWGNMATGAVSDGQTNYDVQSTVNGLGDRGGRVVKIQQQPVDYTIITDPNGTFGSVLDVHLTPNDHSDAQMGYQVDYGTKRRAYWHRRIIRWTPGHTLAGYGLVDGPEMADSLGRYNKSVSAGAPAQKFLIGEVGAQSGSRVGLTANASAADYTKWIIEHNNRTGGNHEDVIVTVREGGAVANPTAPKLNHINDGKWYEILFLIRQLDEWRYEQRFWMTPWDEVLLGNRWYQGKLTSAANKAEYDKWVLGQPNNYDPALDTAKGIQMMRWANYNRRIGPARTVNWTDGTSDFYADTSNLHFQLARETSWDMADSVNPLALPGYDETVTTVTVPAITGMVTDDSRTVMAQLTGNSTAWGGNGVSLGWREATWSVTGWTGLAGNIPTLTTDGSRVTVVTKGQTGSFTLNCTVAGVSGSTSVTVSARAGDSPTVSGSLWSFNRTALTDKTSITSQFNTFSETRSGQIAVDTAVTYASQPTAGMSALSTDTGVPSLTIPIGTLGVGVDAFWLKMLVKFSTGFVSGDMSNLNQHMEGFWAGVSGSLRFNANTNQWYSAGSTQNGGGRNGTDTVWGSVNPMFDGQIWEMIFLVETGKTTTGASDPASIRWRVWQQADGATPSFKADRAATFTGIATSAKLDRFKVGFKLISSALSRENHKWNLMFAEVVNRAVNADPYGLGV